MPFWFRIARVWLPLAFVATLLCGLAYAAVQQNYRMGFDGPQIQLAQDAAARLDAGGSPQDIAGSATVDVANSLAPFVITYAADNSVLAGTGKLHGAVPKPPAGVLDAARAKGLKRVTWQPEAGVRIASVSYATKDGRVVLAGRNMREVELREDALLQMTAIAWAVIVVGSLLTSWVVELLGRRYDTAG